MTIYAYTGTPGSGKSLDASGRIWDALNRREPKPVICNYDINHKTRNYDKAFTYIPNSELSPERLIAFANDWWSTHKFHEDGILLVVDEVQLLHNSRNWSEKGRMGFLEFYSQSRHWGYEVIFICQSDKMIDRQFRALIEYEVKHRKLANFGLVGRILSLVAFGKLFCAITMYYGLRERLSVRFFVPRKRILTLYNSYDIFERTDSSKMAAPLPDPTG